MTYYNQNCNAPLLWRGRPSRYCQECLCLASSLLKTPWLQYSGGIVWVICALLGLYKAGRERVEHSIPMLKRVTKQTWCSAGICRAQKAPEHLSREHAMLSETRTGCGTAVRKPQSESSLRCKSCNELRTQYSANQSMAGALGLLGASCSCNTASSSRSQQNVVTRIAAHGVQGHRSMSAGQFRSTQSRSKSRCSSALQIRAQQPMLAPR